MAFYLLMPKLARVCGLLAQSDDMIISGQGPDRFTCFTVDMSSMSKLCVSPVSRAVIVIYCTASTRPLAEVSKSFNKRLGVGGSYSVTSNGMQRFFREHPIYFDVQGRLVEDSLLVRSAQLIEDRTGTEREIEPMSLEPTSARCVHESRSPLYPRNLGAIRCHEVL